SSVHSSLKPLGLRRCKFKLKLGGPGTRTGSRSSGGICGDCLARASPEGHGQGLGGFALLCLGGAAPADPEEPEMMSFFLSQSARHRLLDEMQQHVLEQCTKDPAMPGPLRNLISSLVRIFWTDMEVELELDLDLDRGGRRSDDELLVESHVVGSGDAEGRSGLLGRALGPLLGPAPARGLHGCEREAELAAAPDVASGMLQVLVVEARDLMPVHGIGTNPYVRGILGQQVRRSRTAWSNLRPAWNCLMEFSVMSTDGTLELEVMSRAPLFGGDTRLGYVSLPLKDITSPARNGRNSSGAASSSSAAPESAEASHLVYRCEVLSGTQRGELVLILDYQELQRPRRSCGGAFRRLARRAAQFRAFFLYHYWPCDKSIFQMYLHEPIDICVLLLALSPFVLVRAIFYTVLLLCLCIPGPPDEHQIVQFILALKSTAIFTDGVGRLYSGMFAYYLCARANTCSSGGAPGSSVGAISVALDLYQEVLVWAVCFCVLPRSLPYCRNSAADPASHQAENGGDAHRGGRIHSMMKYNLVVFVGSLGIFLLLSLRDVAAVKLATGAWPEGSHWRLAENFFWARTIFGLSMFPFLWLLHPQIAKLLTHSTPTGYTCLGTLRRYDPLLHHRRQLDVQEANSQAQQLSTPQAPESQGIGELQRHLSTVSEEETAEVQAKRRIANPVEDLKAAIRWFPGGSLVVWSGGLWLRAAGGAVGVAGSVVSLEIRAASATVSLGLRAADAGRSVALGVACRLVPGSDAAAMRLVHSGSEVIESTAVAVVGRCDRALQRPVALAAATVRFLPGGPTALNALGTLATLGKGLLYLAAAAESPGVANVPGSQTAAEQQSQGEAAATRPSGLLLQAKDLLANSSELAELTERAETMKLEAAARLAELLTRAERLAEREAVEACEALERVRPEISKISQALRMKSQGWSGKLKRAYRTCDSFGRSVLALARELAARLPGAGRVWAGALSRELEDVRQHRTARHRWGQTVTAYTRVIVSPACEALLELRPLLPTGLYPTGPAATHKTQSNSNSPVKATNHAHGSASSSSGGLRARRSGGGQESSGPVSSHEDDEEPLQRAGRRSLSRSSAVSAFTVAMHKLASPRWHQQTQAVATQGSEGALGGSISSRTGAADSLLQGAGLIFSPRRRGKGGGSPSPSLSPSPSTTSLSPDSVVGPSPEAGSRSPSMHSGVFGISPAPRLWTPFSGPRASSCCGLRACGCCCCCC
ncbi:unnamed protein product, partial [Polarella glacialis]